MHAPPNARRVGCVGCVWGFDDRKRLCVTRGIL